MKTFAGVGICRYGAKIGDSTGPLTPLVSCLGDRNAFRLAKIYSHFDLLESVSSLMSLPIN